MSYNTTDSPVEIGEVNFADWLGHILTQEGTSRVILQRATGVTPSAVSHWVNNNRLPDDVSALRRMAEHFAGVMVTSYDKMIREILWRIHVSKVQNSQ